MQKIVVYTAIFGDYDILKLQPKQNIDCDFVCFTDNPKILCQRWAEKQRKIIPCKIEKRHSRLNAKRYRTHPSIVLPGYDVFVYLDWSAILQSENAIERVVNNLWSDDLLVFKHPERNNIRDEAEFTAKAKRKKYEWMEQKMIDQVAHYKLQNMPNNMWLSATWLIVSHNTKKNAEFFEDRRKENIKWTYQDQLSFEYVVRKHKIKRWHITDNLWHNDVVSFLFPHQKQT